MRITVGETYERRVLHESESKFARVSSIILEGVVYELLTATGEYAGWGTRPKQAFALEFGPLKSVSAVKP